MSADHQIDLDIVTNEDGSFSTTVANPGPVRPGQAVRWAIAAERFPRDSEIYVRFFEKDLDGVKVDVDGCISGSTFNHGIGGKGGAGRNGRLIEGKVKLTAHGSYGYDIRYIDAGGDHLLVEQDIVVEGAPEIPARITRRGESGMRIPVAKSASGVRPGKAAPKPPARKPAATKAKAARPVKKARTAAKPKSKR